MIRKRAGDISINEKEEKSLEHLKYLQLAVITIFRNNPIDVMSGLKVLHVSNYFR